MALRRRGVAEVAAEDAVQDAVARAITHAVPFDDADDLLPWIHTVAWRIVLDGRKRDHRLVHDVPERAAADDTAVAAEARLRLSRLRELVGGLSSADRAVLDGAAVPGDRQESVRWAVRRHRVRARLLAMLDGAALVLLWLRHRAGRPAAKMAMAAAPIAAASMWAVAPHFNEAATPPRVVPTAPQADVVGVGVPPASAPAVRTTSHGDVSPKAKPADLPRIEIKHPGPPGGATWVRPKDPDDALLCVTNFIVVGDRCIQLPVRVTG